MYILLGILYGIYLLTGLQLHILNNVIFAKFEKRLKPISFLDYSDFRFTLWRTLGIETVKMLLNLKLIQILSDLSNFIIFV